MRQLRENYGQNNILQKFAADITSQSGEDGILKRIFEILPVSDRWCVEFGAWDGKKFSNTYNLIANNGWSGVLIEAQEAKFIELLKTYEGNEKAHCIKEFVEFEGERSLDNILAKTPIPDDFDLLSIDVDSTDYHIWDSVKQYRPKVVVVEYNPSIPNDIYFIQDADFNLNHGNSLLALTELGKSKGYELVATTSTNGIYAKSEYYPLFGIEDNSLDKMRNEQPWATKVFQLYDGTMVVAGLNKMIWQGVPIHNDDIQVLPKALRRFGDKASKN
jgi:hypothetical protein